jgi:ADP-heptose:LPS heptosyltransferase
MVSGGVGDYVVVARFLRDLVAYVEPLQFEIYCSNDEAGAWAFGGIRGFREAYNEFLFGRVGEDNPLSLRLSQFVVVLPQKTDWAELRQFKRLMQVAGNVMRFRRKIEVMINNHPYMDGFLAQKAVYMNCTRANFLHAMAKIPYGGDTLNLALDPSVYNRLQLKTRPYITVSNGFDPEFPLSNRQATKCYPHTAILVTKLKQRFPEIAVVQVGTSTSVNIPDADIDLIGKTNLPQVAAVLAHAQLHIDNEGGLVHIAKCLGTRSCVIFGPTSVDYFGYPENINVRPPFCGGCWWINETWMDSCPRGFETARCLSEQDPEAVLSAISAALAPSTRKRAAVSAEARKRNGRKREVMNAPDHPLDADSLIAQITKTRV